MASGSAWRRGPTTAARRIDGRPKVTGAKLYNADFRVRNEGFATLGYPDVAFGMVKVTPEEQAVLVAAEPAMFGGSGPAKPGHAELL